MFCINDQSYIMICISTCRATMEIVERSWSEQRLKSLRGRGLSSDLDRHKIYND